MAPMELHRFGKVVEDHFDLVQLLGAMQGNASGFSDRGQLPSAQQPQLQEKPR